MNPNLSFLKWLIPLLVVIVAVYFIFRPAEKITNFPPQNDMVVAFGDSLVAGNGSTSGHDFVSNLSAMIGRPIINLGVAGNTTADALARVDKVVDLKPGIVLVLLGGNDYLRHVPQETTFANLDQIISTIQSSGAVVVVVGVRGGLLSDHYNSDFRDLAKRHGALFVPNILDGLLGDKSLMSDEIHPNDAGYVRIANKVYPMLKKAMNMP
jgi:lysophospholipase L1-like esterase